jgi:three-Cys-motif partner protein
MRQKFANRQYVDLFAGPGRCVLSDGSGEFDGTPLETLKTTVPFSGYHFVEAGPEEFAALKTRASVSDRFPSIEWYSEDANSAARKIRNSLSPEALALAVIDPTGLHFHFSSLKTLVNDRRVDLIYLFPDAMDVRRNLKLYLSTSQLDDVLGTERWRAKMTEELEKYPFEAHAEHCPGATKIVFNVFKDQLTTLGYPFVSVGDEIRFKNSKSAELYYLVFASRHEKGHEFWNKIKVIDPVGQRQMRYE